MHASLEVINKHWEVQNFQKCTSGEQNAGDQGEHVKNRQKQE